MRNLEPGTKGKVTEARIEHVVCDVPLKSVKDCQNNTQQYRDRIEPAINGVKSEGGAPRKSTPGGSDVVLQLIDKS
ncbi:hypothetical protein SDJN02_25044, partial [Cucurbita argyrosperma subsp. argyrosperma]